MGNLYTMQKNKLIRTTTHKNIIADYCYNGIGQRVKKEIDGKIYEYVLDITSEFNDILEVKTSSNANVNTTEEPEKYIYGVKYPVGSKLIGTTKGRELESIYMNDELGSVIRVINLNKEIEVGKEQRKALIEYNTFGKEREYKNKNIGFTSKISIIKSFTGYEEDKETGLDFVQARYYMKDIGRFVSEDTNKGNIEEQLSLNWYIHCYNNPLSYVDLDGYKAESTQTSSSVWIRDIEDINGNKLFPELNDIDVINSGKVFPTATYIDGTKNLIGHKKDGQIIIKYNGQEQILNQEGNKNKYEQNKATNAIFFNKDGKAHLDIHMLNKLFGFEDLADYVFICPEIRADVEKAIAAREAEEKAKVPLTFEEELEKLGFPPCYIKYLMELHEKYPKWKFEPVHTGIDFEEFVKYQVDNGLKCAQIPSYSTSTRFTSEDSNQYYYANEDAIRFFMHPYSLLKVWGDDNYLNVMQFLKAEQNLPKEYVDQVFDSLFQNGKSEVIKKIQESRVSLNPIFLATIYKIEDGPVGETYNGSKVYNLFNIGAYSGRESSKKYAYDNSWFTIEDCIKGSDNQFKKYLDRNQDTIYSLDWDYSQFSKNQALKQYATLVDDAEQKIINISGNGKKGIFENLDYNLIFKIPIYENICTYENKSCEAFRDPNKK